MAVADEILALRDRKQAVLVQESERLAKRQRLQEIAVFLDGQSGMILNYEEELARQLVELVKISEDRVLVVFKSGAEVGVGYS